MFNCIVTVWHHVNTAVYCNNSNDISRSHLYILYIALVSVKHPIVTQGAIMKYPSMISLLVHNAEVESRLSVVTEIAYKSSGILASVLLYSHTPNPTRENR